MSKKIYINAAHHGLASAAYGAEVISITAGVVGFRLEHVNPEELDKLNPPGLSNELERSFVAGSMFGWDAPAAVPAIEFCRVCAQSEIEKLVADRKVLVDALDFINRRIGGEIGLAAATALIKVGEL